VDFTDVLRTARGTPTGLVEMEKCRMSIMSICSEESSGEGICVLLQRRTRRIELTEVVWADKAGNKCWKVDVNRLNSGGGLTSFGVVKPFRTSFC
jgi:hypothetical protein